MDHEVEVDVFSAWHVYRVISETSGGSPIVYWQSNEFKMASKHGWKMFKKWFQQSNCWYRNSKSARPIFCRWGECTLFALQDGKTSVSHTEKAFKYPQERQTDTQTGKKTKIKNKKEKRKKIRLDIIPCINYIKAQQKNSHDYAR